MECISSVIYSILVNEKLKEVFLPTRGLRQKDPLSIYLFLLCGKGLSSLINYHEAKRNIKGLEISRGCPSLSHILFADDCILLCKTSMKE